MENDVKMPKKCGQLLEDAPCGFGLFLDEHGK